MATLSQVVEEWEEHFRSFGVPAEMAASYVDFVRRMVSRGVPPIFEFDHLARLLGRTNAYLASVVASPEHHYRSFRIPKRSGGHRTIEAPYPALLECQQWILQTILSRAVVHFAAHGFRNDRSIVTNARLHLNRDALLKMDLQDFFPSIPTNRIIGVFRNLGYPPNVSFYLTQLCCVRGRLPQGAATSPALSNIVARRLDRRLMGLAKTNDMRYSRYADDLTFSGPRIGIGFSLLIDHIAQEEGFGINRSKTRLCRSRNKRIVTGLSVTGTKLRVPRTYKRKLRQELHYILTYGLHSHVSKKKIRNPFYLDSIHGKLQFWHMIEPEDKFVVTSLRRIASLKDHLGTQ